MGCWADPQCILFFGSAIFTSIVICVSRYTTCNRQRLPPIFMIYPSRITFSFEFPYCVTHQFFIGIKSRTSPYPKIIRHKKEEYYQDPSDKSEHAFPSLHDAPTINLSVIVPAYNEEDRCELF